MIDEKDRIPNYVKKLKTLTDKQFIEELNQDPAAYVGHDKIVYELSVKYKLSTHVVNRICNSQFSVARQMMQDENYPNIKFLFIGKLAVTKGRRYYKKLINDARKKL